MSRREIYVGAQLLGRMVRDTAGQPVGRIEEVHAEHIDTRYVVREFVTGARGAFERLSLETMSRWLLKLVGLGEPIGGSTIPTSLMDLTDPARPRLRCTREELERVS